MRILLDANFLVLPFQFSITLSDEFERLVGPQYDLYTLERTYHEARDLRDGKYKSLVNKLVDILDITLINTEATERVDDQLISYGKKGFIICTNDKDVRSRLADDQLPCIYLRQQNHLEGDRLHI